MVSHKKWLEAMQENRVLRNKIVEHLLSIHHPTNVLRRVWREVEE